MPSITLTKKQIENFPNTEWAKPDDEVVVAVDLPTEECPNPSVEYLINGEPTASQECWSDLPSQWQIALRNEAKREFLTITLTGEPPVRICRSLWPVLTSGSGETTGREYRITVRQNADGRAIVYGVYTTQWQDDRNIRVGRLISAGAKLVGEIYALADEIRAPDCVAQECIAGLPAIDLDMVEEMDAPDCEPQNGPETMDEAAARC